LYVLDNQRFLDVDVLSYVWDAEKAVYAGAASEDHGSRKPTTLR
jgi:hypothetical protein